MSAGPISRLKAYEGTGTEAPRKSSRRGKSMRSPAAYSWKARVCLRVVHVKPSVLTGIALSYICSLQLEDGSNVVCLNACFNAETTWQPCIVCDMAWLYEYAGTSS